MAWYGDAWDWTKRAAGNTVDWVDQSLLGGRTREERAAAGDVAAMRDVRQRMIDEYDNAQQTRGYTQVNAASAGPLAVHTPAHVEEAAQQARVQLGQTREGMAFTAGETPIASAATVGQAERAAAAGTAQVPVHEAARLNQATVIDRPDTLRVAAAGDSAARGVQTQMLDLMLRAAEGGAPSAAEIQMRRGMDAAIAAQRGMAASARGRNAWLAMHQAMNNAADIQQQVARNTAELRANEMAQARGALASAAEGVRAGDIGMSQFNAGAWNTARARDQDAFLRAALANQDATNRFALTRAELDQQAGMFNAGNFLAARERGLDRTQQANLANASAANEFAVRQAMLEQEARQAYAQRQQANQQFSATQQQSASFANADAANRAALAQGQIDLSQSAANQDAINRRSELRTNVQQESGLANQSAANRRGEFNATTSMTAQQANQRAELEARQLDDAERERRRRGMLDASSATAGNATDAATLRRRGAESSHKFVGAAAQGVAAGATGGATGAA